MLQLNIEKLEELISHYVVKDRYDQGLKLEELANLSGLSRTTIWRIRKNPETVTLMQLEMLAGVFDVNAIELITDID